MEDARHRWEALNADHGGPWGLLAISFGGMVALEWGKEHPYDFQRIVAINTSVGSLSPAQHRLRPGVWLDFLKLRVQSHRSKRNAPFLGSTAILRQTAIPSLKKSGLGYAAHKPNPTQNSIRQILAGVGIERPITSNHRF